VAFKTGDFKKTSRSGVLYPYRIRDDRYTAAIGYAIGYYERMVGRRRSEFETETLLEFFGDPRLARGLVACLGRTYTWREPTFAEEFGEEATKQLWRLGLATSAALRAKLYGLANGRYGGVILPSERAEALEFLCQELPLTPSQLEKALTLDAEGQRILAKLGPTPTPEEIVSRYNYHSLETALCHAELLKLRLHGPVWNIVRSVHNLARRYRVRYEVSNPPSTLFGDEIELTLRGGRDALGNWSRTGRRLVRALLRLLASHPDSLVEGEGLIHLKGQTLTLRLDGWANEVLGVAAKSAAAEVEAWEQDLAETFQKAWSRAFVGGKTAGWRLRRDPEPLVAAGAMVVPDFVLQRGDARLMLCLAASKGVAEPLMQDLGRLGRQARALVVVPGHVAQELRACPAPVATYDERPADAIAPLVGLLEAQHPRAARKPQTPWQRLDQLVAEEGFVGEEAVATLLSCPREEALRLVQRWGGPTLHVLPGLGVCAPEMLGEIRQLLEQAA
jgi:predicted nuclease of restriction endonuclease-like RecB superfamily